MNFHELQVYRPVLEMFTYMHEATYYTRKLPTGNQIYIYYFDELGRNIGITNPLNNKETSEYDTDNNLIKLIDHDGNSTDYTYDAQGNLLTKTDVFGKTEAWTYTSFNKIATVTDKLGHTGSYEYDANQNVSAIHFPDGSTATFSYNTNGQIGRTKSKKYNI